jgi:phenylalanyl-tRNA synthetase beta chain
VETQASDEIAVAHPALHPRRVASVLIDGRAVGVLGELHPDVVEALELVGPVVYAELDVHALLEASQAEKPPQLKAAARFPASARDIAIVVEEATPAGAVGEVLRKAGGALVEAVELFDLYRGDQVGRGQKSLAFRVTYRDPEATLTDQRVDDAHGKVVAEAKRHFAASTR